MVLIRGFGILIIVIFLFGCISSDRWKGVGEIYSIKSGKWSSPDTWNAGRIPQTGDTTVVSSGTEILYDVNSSERIENITINGVMKFSSDETTLLKTGNILVYGTLEIGNEDYPINENGSATISFIADNESKFKGGFDFEPSDVGLWVMGGVLQINGRKVETTWTHLADNATAGSYVIKLAAKPDWHAGDHIFVATTSFNMSESEDNYIRSINGSMVQLQNPLKYSHYGSYPLAAEVGLLTRNVVITSENKNQRAHTMIMDGGSANISYAEFSYMGPRNVLSRYPIHYHLLGDKADNKVVGNSVWDSGNRCITVHGTDNLLVMDNVAYNASGHCYFLENGMEEGNKFVNNLGVLVSRSNTTASDERASVFWITNPRNIFINNTGAASVGPVYWFLLNTTFKDMNGDSVDVGKLPIETFYNNTGHSSRESALYIEGFGSSASLDSEQESLFGNVVAWKNNVQGIWARGTNLIFTNALLFDNPTGFTFANGNDTLKDSVIIGNYEKGGSTEIPRYNESKYLTGFDIYDGPSKAINVTFINFVNPAGERHAGAVTYEYPNQFIPSPDNVIINPVFVNSTEFYFPKPMFAAENGSVANVVYNNTEFCLVPDSAFYTSGNCTFDENWNAWVCTNCGRVKFSGLLLNDTNEPVETDILIYNLQNNESQLIRYGKGGNLHGHYSIYAPPGNYDFRYTFPEYPNISLSLYNVSMFSDIYNLLGRIDIINGTLKFDLSTEYNESGLEAGIPSRPVEVMEMGRSLRNGTRYDANGTYYYNISDGSLWINRLLASKEEFVVDY